MPKPHNRHATVPSSQTKSRLFGSRERGGGKEAIHKIQHRSGTGHTGLRQRLIITITAVSLLILCKPYGVAPVRADPFNVLVVMSYEAGYPWVMEIREGLEPLLGKIAKIQYFYLNTKVDWQGGPHRAKEAWNLFQTLQPDGVIAADDDAQSMFVVPYLKNRVDTPVIFCGVNSDPKAYGYPASNVTGVLEREPMMQSLLFLAQLVPTAARFGMILEDSPTARAVEMQLEQEKHSYPMEYIGSRVAHTMPEAVKIVKELRSACDALVYITMEGLPDKNGSPLTDKQILPTLNAAFGKPMITNALYRVKYGALCAVVKTGQEHGAMAAEMLSAAMRGTTISELPITQNRFGQRVINVDTMVALGIEPKAFLIRSAKLVRTQE